MVCALLPRRASTWAVDNTGANNVFESLERRRLVYAPAAAPGVAHDDRHVAQGTRGSGCLFDTPIEMIARYKQRTDAPRRQIGRQHRAQKDVPERAVVKDRIFRFDNRPYI